jgi:hypothetical protein
VTDLPPRPFVSRLILTMPSPVEVGLLSPHTQRVSGL